MMLSHHVRLASFVLLALACLAPQGTLARRQPQASPFGFRAGQSVYIAAYAQNLQTVVTDSETTSGTGHYTNVHELDVERKVRNEIEEWGFFRVVDKPSDADFIFLAYRENSSMEGLALPSEAYRRHFKEQFDLDALRDAAYGRYVAGPLNIPTVSRLSDRLVKQFREKVAGRGKR
ncbi:MAG: hypothetical protein ACJ741_08540 [Pyrinomonadaceae bacterium]